MGKRHFLSASALVLGAVSQPGQAWAAEQPSQPTASDTSAGSGISTALQAVSESDIVVTATRREEKLKDVPISVTAITGAQLQQAGASGTRDLAILTPGLTMQTTGFGVQPTLRGVGNTNTSGGFEQPVAIYVDGVYIANMFSSVFDLVNTDSIQVLKGPQGTLFGRNATGGAILITTKQPGSKPTGNLRLSYGRFDEVKAEAYVSGPVTDTISADLSLLYHDDNGYSRDVLRDTRLDTYREFSARSKILWSPDTDTSILFIGDISKVLDNTATSIRPVGRTTSVVGGFVPEGPRELALTFDPYGKAWSGGGSIQAQHDFGGVTAKSISSYRETRYRARTDQDRTQLPVNRVDVIINEHYITQELTLTSSRPSPLQWVTGVYYFHDRSYTPTISNGVALTYPVMRTTSYAGFAEGTYAITDKLKLTAGIRYNHEKRSDDQKKPSGNTFLYSYRTATANAWTPRFSLLYALNDSSNVYATYSKGFKSGFFNAGTFDQPAVEPETLQMYEVGYKYARGGTSFNLSAFYSDYQNLQLSTRLPNGITTTLNAAGAKIYGVDADFSARLSEALILRLGGAYTHSKYVDFLGAPRYDPLPAGGNVLTTQDASGNPLIRTPKFTGTSQLTYEQPIGNGRVSATGSLYYNSGFAWTPDNRVRQGDYVLLNGQIAWSPDDDHYRISVWGKNLTNTLYSLGVSVSGFADAAAYARPRSYGVTAEYRF